MNPDLGSKLGLGALMDGAGNAARAAEDLVREANHRIANQLALLTGMIQLQIESLANGPELLPRATVREHLRTAMARIVAIGNLNRQLSQSSGMLIDLCPVLSGTRDELIASLAAQGRVQIRENLGSNCHVTGEQASVLCLVMNEIIVNALKHARPSGDVVCLTLNCSRDGATISVELADDGVGLPADFDEGKNGRVGFKLIRNLVRQIGAELSMQSDGHGLVFRIALPHLAS